MASPLELDVEILRRLQDTKPHLIEVIERATVKVRYNPKTSIFVIALPAGDIKALRVVARSISSFDVKWCLISWEHRADVYLFSQILLQAESQEHGSQEVNVSSSIGCLKLQVKV